MFKTKQLGIIYLDRNSLTYFSSKFAPITYNYPAGSVREFEIVNEELFSKELSNFIQNNKIIPSDAVILMSPEVLFEKEFLSEVVKKPEEIAKQQSQLNQKNPVAAPSQTQPAQNIESHELFLEERVRQIQLFLDTVPIEEVASKTYKFDKGVRVIATNKRLYETAIIVFNKHLFNIDAVLPITMLPKELLPTNMNQDAAKKIFNKLEFIKQFSMLEENSPALVKPSEAYHIQMTTKVTTKREYALISVFGSLLLILVGVAYTTFFTSSKPKHVASQSTRPAVRPSLTPTIVISPTPDASVAAKLKSSLKVAINGGTALQANLLKQQLLESGFGNVSVKPGTSPASGKTLIIFSNKLSSVEQEAILQEIKQNLLQVTVQETTAPEADIVINL